METQTEPSLLQFRALYKTSMEQKVDVDPVIALALFAAAFVAGAINAVAGGGSLVSFPALLAVGLPAVQANVTNTVALWPGYVGGSLNYRHELRPQRRLLLALSPPSVLGALAGSWLLLATPEEVFDAIVPFLILGACALMAFQDYINVRVARRQAQPPPAIEGAALDDRRRAGNGAATMENGPGASGDDAAAVGRAEKAADGTSPLLWGSTFLLGVYGAYFGAALGIMLLAALGVLLPDDIQRSNALKGMLSLVMNAIAVVYFAFFGPVAWAMAAVMAVGAVAGGWSGVGVARRLGRTWLRRVVVAYGVVVAAVLIYRLLFGG